MSNKRMVVMFYSQAEPRLEATYCSAMGKVVVLGSINQDVVAHVSAHPRAGETVVGHSLANFPGGKGLNQVIAAARLGVATAMIATTGVDPAGSELKAYLARNGVNIAFIRSARSRSTGTALITVDKTGENSIVVVPGANDETADAPSLGLEQGDVLMSQNEVPEASIADFFERGKQAGCMTVLNAAPFRPLSDRLNAATDLLLVNETELAGLSGQKVSGTSDLQQLAAAADAVTGSSRVVVTLGSKGAVDLGGSEAVKHRGHLVEVVDTTGAGDCFAGALASRLAQGGAVDEAIEMANRAAAISVGRHGAADSMPTRDEVAAWRVG